MEFCGTVSGSQLLEFGFCFFHAVVQDRRQYGPIGWNISYSFTTEDLITNRRQLMTFVNQYDTPPYKVTATKNPG